MSLSPAARVVLQRRLSRRARPPFAAAGLVGLLFALAFLAPAVPLGAGAVGAAVAYGVLADELENDIRRIESLHDRSLLQTTHVYDRHGVLLREMFLGGRRTYVPLARIPEHVRLATIAVEDKTFYENPGVDVVGILRAVQGEITGQRELGGGSTLTQQFVRNAVFTWEERSARSYARKAKEIVLALILTRRESKDQILEWYLNEVFYGNFAFGIEAAAETVFGKPATDLDLAEAALLAGLPQMPGQLDPLDPDPDVARRVRNRQRVVLNLMAANDFITQAEADRAALQELEFARPDDEDRFLAPHFTVFVEKELERLLGAERLALGGLRVHTTLDLDLQQLGEGVVREHVDKLRDRHDLSNAALVALEPGTGQILAMVGSKDYWDDEIDGRVNVTIRERQPGSSIKPITYATAFDQGMAASHVLWDVPMELFVPERYEPENYDRTFRGPVRLRAALANSYNIPALKLLGVIRPGERHLEAHPEDANKMGLELAIDTAHRMGIGGLRRPPWDYGLGLTLGGGEVTLLDLATVNGTLANLGLYVPPRAVLLVTDSDGAVVYDLADELAAAADTRPEPVIDPRAAYLVTHILSDNEARTPAFGASSPLRLGVPAAVKTGTTNDYRDNWTLGYTPYLVAGVWAGNNDNRPMRHSSGVTGAAPIWNAFMRNVVADSDRRARIAAAVELGGRALRTDFERPEGLVEGRVCRLQSLNRIAATCLEYETELFLEDEVPPGVLLDGEQGAPPWPAGHDAAADGAQAPAAGSDWVTVVAAVVPLPPPPPELLAAAEAAGEPLHWPPALLCQAAPDGFGADKAQPVAVLPLPEDEPGSPIGEQRRFVIQWAGEKGWSALEPVQICTPEMVVAALERGALPGFAEGAVDPAALALLTGNEYRLNLSPGALLTARTTLTGTVRYNPSQVEYYKVELGRGVQPREWITLGDIHFDPVLDGPLEVLDALSLPADDYVVRLVLVKRDGNFLEPPHSVPIRIGR